LSLKIYLRVFVACENKAADLKAVRTLIPRAFL